jgi:hypothetical protein
MHHQENQFGVNKIHKKPFQLSPCRKQSAKSIEAEKDSEHSSGKPSMVNSDCYPVG